MFFVLLTLCIRTVLSAGSSYEEEDTMGVDIFERYAGNLIYNSSDGRCIACNGTCDSDHVVSPHSWKANLGEDNDFHSCENYAMSVGQYVVAFTWWESEHNCSLHVLGEEHDIAAEMINFNGYDWNEEYESNDGPIFRTRYAPGFIGSNSDAVCYYGLQVNPQKNIVTEGNTICFAVVVLTMIAWKTWMRYTGEYPDKSNVQPHGYQSYNEEEDMDSTDYDAKKDSPDYDAKKDSPDYDAKKHE